MSQQLNFILRNKTNPLIEVNLSWFSTTPARTMAGLGAFPYTEEWEKITKEGMRDYLEIIQDKINSCKQCKEDCKKKEESLYKLMIASKNKDVAEMLFEKSEDIKKYTEEWNEEIEEWEYYKNHIIIMLQYLESNEKDWDLYYCNC